MQVPLSFRDSGSAIHRLSPFVLPAWVCVVLLGSLVLSHPVALLAVLIATVPVAAAARVLRPWATTMKYVVWMGLAIVVINAIVSNQGSHVLLEAGFSLPVVGTPRLTLEALAYGAAMAVRLSAIISAFTLLNLCVHPDDLMRVAIRLRLPYRSVLVTSLSTRFVPVLLADAAMIVDVQRSRGLEFDRGNLLERVRNRGALILPLLSNSLDRATQVAEAMESRAYGAGVKRTFYRDAPLAQEDVAALALLCGAAALVVAMRVLGLDAYAYYPSLGTLALPTQAWAALAVLFVLLVALIPLAAAGRRRRRD